MSHARARQTLVPQDLCEEVSFLPRAPSGKISRFPNTDPLLRTKSMDTSPTPDATWITCWRQAGDGDVGRTIGPELLASFQAFWTWAKLDAKAKGTQRTYADALLAFGCWLIEQIGTGMIDPKITVPSMLKELAGDEAPLIDLDSPSFQEECDRVARKLQKWLDSRPLELEG